MGKERERKRELEAKGGKERREREECWYVGVTGATVRFGLCDCEQ